MAEPDKSDASSAAAGNGPAQLLGVLTRFLPIALASLFGGLAVCAAHLYYLDDGALWALWLTGFAIAGLGAIAKRSGYPSRGDAALGASVVVFIIAALLELPSSARVEQRAEFSSLAAMDAKIDRFLKTRQVDSSVLATASFDGFEPGSEVLDCDSEPARDGLNAILDGVERARERGQRPILVLIGMTDRMPLGKALQKRYESSAGLAGARADAVRACLGTVRPDGRRIAKAMETVRLTTGPSYTPQVGEPAPVEAARMAQDRQVSALLISLPVSAAAPASTPASQPPNPPRQASPPPIDRCEPGKGGWPLVLLVIGLGGLAVLALAVLPRSKKPASADAPAIEPDEKIPDSQLGEALTHVRDMHEMFAELRTKNFNFFIVIVAATIAGAAGVTEKTNVTLQFISSLAAAVTCIVFFGIEKRTVEMLGDARSELERLEKKVGVNLSRRDKWVGGKGRSRKVTHTSLYLSAFLIVYFGALASIYLHWPW